MSRKLKTIDLFAGIGGIRLGFEHFGCENVFTSEWDRDAQIMTENYFVFVVKNFINKPNHKIYQNPINTQLSFKKIEIPIIQINWLANV